MPLLKTMVRCTVAVVGNQCGTYGTPGSTDISEELSTFRGVLGLLHQHSLLGPRVGSGKSKKGWRIIENA